MTRAVLAWDVGGVNTKAAWLPAVDHPDRPALAGLRTARRPFEVWRRPEALATLLAEMAAGVPPPDLVALTMTAELSDVFRTRAEGVRRVLEAAARACPGTPLLVLDVDGRLVPFASIGRDAAALRPFAAANWVAAARLVAAWRPAAVLVDVGSTTTDVVPVAGGRVLARGRDDASRLAAGELVYTGALRTPVGAVAPALPVAGRPTRTSPEHFALVADAHLLLGDLAAEAYDCPTADGRPATPEFAAERLARVVCAEAADLGPEGVRALAAAVADRQVTAIAEGLLQVLSATPGAFAWPVVAAGVGAWLARRAADRLRLPVDDLAALAGPGASEVAPAVALAWLARRDAPRG